MTPIEIILVALYLPTNIFWAWVCLRLTNKLMSRSFLEYQEGLALPDKLKEQMKIKKQALENNHFSGDDLASVTEIL